MGHVMDYQKICASSVYRRAEAKSSKLCENYMTVHSHLPQLPRFTGVYSFVFLKLKQAIWWHQLKTITGLISITENAGVPNLFPTVAKLPVFLHQVVTELCISKEAALN